MKVDVKLTKQDLGTYGEAFDVHIRFANGVVHKFQIQEHQALPLSVEFNKEVKSGKWDQNIEWS